MRVQFREWEKKMTDSKVTCPKCHASFDVSEAMAEKMKKKFQDEFAEKESEFNEKLEAQARELEAKYSAKRGVELKKAVEAAKAEALEAAKVDIEDLQSQVEAKDRRLADATAKELELRRLTREVQESKETLALELNRKLDEERQKIRLEVQEGLGEEFSSKKAIWDTQRSSMERLIEDLKQKASQGSTQTQGEAAELALEAALKEAFPHDVIEEIGKGIRGADMLQRVMTRSGAAAGVIQYELKKTKTFTESWLQKSKDDQRAAKADVAVIVTQAMPEGIRHIGQLEGVWICSFPSFLGLALALRSGLLEVAQAKQAMVGKKEKLDHLYDYLSGVEFRGRIEAIVEGFTTLREDLDAEKKAFERIWAKREKAISRASNNTAGIYGDLQGLIGSSLQEIPQLQLEAK